MPPVRARPRKRDELSVSLLRLATAVCSRSPSASLVSSGSATPRPRAATEQPWLNSALNSVRRFCRWSPDRSLSAWAWREQADRLPPFASSEIDAMLDDDQSDILLFSCRPYCYARVRMRTLPLTWVTGTMRSSSRKQEGRFWDMRLRPWVYRPSCTADPNSKPLRQERLEEPALS